MPHMSPLAFDDVAEDIQERFVHYKNTRGFTPNSIQTMARRPNIVRAFMQLNQAVLYEGTVSEELKMLVSLIASQAAGCRYCQAHMANLSKIQHFVKQLIPQHQAIMRYIFLVYYLPAACIVTKIISLP